MIYFIRRFVKKRNFVFAGIFLIIVFFWWKNIAGNEKKQESFIVKRGDLVEELTLSGEIDADEKVTLGFQTGGLLSWVGVKEGGEVKQYQSIASLDQRQLQKELTKELNVYLKTRQDFDDKKAEYDSKTLTDGIRRILTKSQADLDNSVLDVEIQDLTIKLATLTTPIDGIVTKVDTPFAGVNILATQKLFEIVNPKTIYFKISADQTEVIQLPIGITGYIILDSFPEKKINATVRSISLIPQSDETETVYKVMATFMDSSINSNIYRLGMTGDISFVILEKKNVLHLPIRFVKFDEKGKYVYVTSDKKKSYIQTGMETDLSVEIKNGLHVGDRVYD